MNRSRSNLFPERLAWDAAGTLLTAATPAAFRELRALARSKGHLAYLTIADLNRLVAWLRGMEWLRQAIRAT